MIETNTAQEIRDNGYTYSQKAEGTRVVHLWSDILGKNLCGVNYMLAYFKPIEGWPVCKKCLKSYHLRHKKKHTLLSTRKE